MTKKSKPPKAFNAVLAAAYEAFETALEAAAVKFEESYSVSTPIAETLDLALDAAQQAFEERLEAARAAYATAHAVRRAEHKRHS